MCRRRLSFVWLFFPSNVTQSSPPNDWVRPCSVQIVRGPHGGTRGDILGSANFTLDATDGLQARFGKVRWEGLRAIIKPKMRNYGTQKPAVHRQSGFKRLSGRMDGKRVISGEFGKVVGFEVVVVVDPKMLPTGDPWTSRLLLTPDPGACSRVVVPGGRHPHPNS